MEIRGEAEISVEEKESSGSGLKWISAKDDKSQKC